MEAKNKKTEMGGRPILALEQADVGNLDSVLRGYYLSQIKSLEKRKDRKLARQLLQDHLILPKSRQRTSKDAAYIKEILGIELDLLEKLEASRLIRRIQKSGNNPIYEVSHDTLVEPILAERRDRLAIAAFIKRTWKYAALLLLFWFFSGMVFQDAFEVLPDLFRQAHTVDVVLEKQTIAYDEESKTFMIAPPPLKVAEEIKTSDSVQIRIPIDPLDLGRIRRAVSGGNASVASGDTLSIVLVEPIEIPVDESGQAASYQSFSDVLVPLATYGGQTGDPIYARISGSLRMTNADRRRDAVSQYDQSLVYPLQINLGDTLVQARTVSQTIPVNFTLSLSELFDNETDRNTIRNLMGDRLVSLNYAVRVRPAPSPPPQVKIEYPAVQGIEVQYSDGTRRFLSGENAENATGTSATVHVVAAGETLFSIAKKYGVVDQFGNTSVEPIKALNGLQDNTLAVGQALRIPQ